MCVCLRKRERGGKERERRRERGERKGVCCLMCKRGRLETEKREGIKRERERVVKKKV